jgi:hypothetical protein
VNDAFSAEFSWHREDIMRLDEMALEYQALRADLARIDLDELGDPVRDRLTALARSMVKTPSGSTRDLVSKTEVLMDWLDPNGSGVVAAELTASLCRDILLLFPAEP